VKKVAEKERFVDFDPGTGRMRTTPQQVFIETTSRCNLACVHCSKDYGHEENGHPSLDMPVETVRRLLPWVRDARAVNLNMIGEPLVHPRFGEILDLVSDGKAEVAFNTNGLKLTRACCEHLVAKRVAWVGVSIDGLESNEPIRGVAYRTVRERVVELCDAKRRANAGFPKVSIAYTLMRRNLHELPRVLADLLPLGIDEVHLQPLIIFYETLRNENIYTQPEVRQVVAASREIAERYGTELRVFRSRLEADERYEEEGLGEQGLQLGEHSGRYGCIDPFFEIKIRSTGDVMACSYGLTPDLNVNTMDLDAIWNHPWYLELRRRLYRRVFEGRCEKCPFIFGSAENQVALHGPGVRHSEEDRFLAGWRGVHARRDLHAEVGPAGDPGIVVDPAP
jgi:MoaA/NifB/PqqE/SkfB family radical SAM enzyme